MGRRLSVSVVVVSMMTFGLVAPASAAERRAEARYEQPAAGSSDAGGGCAAGADGCESFPSGSGEILMSVEIIDDGGGTVSASASWDTDGDGFSDTGFEICGTSDGFQEIPPSTDISVFVWSAPSSGCPTAMATAGLVKVIFSTGGSTGTDDGTDGGTRLGSPRAGLGFSDRTPKRGTVTIAKANLKICGSHAGTTIELQKKQGTAWKKVARKKLSSTCRARFRVTANFNQATFRSFWPKQDDDHRAGKAKPITVTTH